MSADLREQFSANIYDANGQLVTRPRLTDDQRWKIRGGHYSVVKVERVDGSFLPHLTDTLPWDVGPDLRTEVYCMKCGEKWGAFGCTTIQLLRLVEAQEQDASEMEKRLAGTQRVLAELAVKSEWAKDKSRFHFTISYMIDGMALMAAGVTLVDASLLQIRREIAAALAKKSPASPLQSDPAVPPSQDTHK